MRPNIPWALWIAIVGFAFDGIVKLACMFVLPYALIGAALSLAIARGLYTGRRWAYAMAFAMCVLSVMIAVVGWSTKPFVILVVLAWNAAIFVSLILAKEHFPSIGGRRAARDPLVCPECGYSLLGLTVPRCPECGEQFRIPSN